MFLLSDGLLFTEKWVGSMFWLSYKPNEERKKMKKAHAKYQRVQQCWCPHFQKTLQPEAKQTKLNAPIFFFYSKQIIYSQGKKLHYLVTTSSYSYFPWVQPAFKAVLRRRAGCKPLEHFNCCVWHKLTITCSLCSANICQQNWSCTE